MINGPIRSFLSGISNDEISPNAFIIRIAIKGNIMAIDKTDIMIKPCALGLEKPKR
jgi:hypothetical protein